MSCVSSVYSEINIVAREFNQQDRIANQRTRNASRNYIPIGTGTLWKTNLMLITGLCICLIPRALTGCYREENQNELTCVVINDTANFLGFSCVSNLAWLGYRMFRNNPS
jgi:hypothetical protein